MVVVERGRGTGHRNQFRPLLALVRNCQRQENRFLSKIDVLTQKFRDEQLDGAQEDLRTLTRTDLELPVNGSKFPN